MNNTNTTVRTIRTFTAHVDTWRKLDAEAPECARGVSPLEQSLQMAAWAVHEMRRQRSA